MTITLELPPETEASLLAQAQACGLTLNAFVKTIIMTQAAAELSSAIADGQNTSHTALDEREKRVQELFDAFDNEDIPTGVSEGAFHRENWYR